MSFAFVTFCPPYLTVLTSYLGVVSTDESPQMVVASAVTLGLDFS